MQRPHSRKLRALEQTYAKPLDEIAQQFAGEPLSYVEIAERWQAAVAERYPELDAVFGPNDVYRVFRAAGVRRRTVYSIPARVAA